MKRAILTAAALAAGLGCATAGTANASPATDAFNAACTANPGFFSFAVTGLEEDREGLSRLCSCLATEFSGLRDADLAMLTKDVDGTANAADRTAYGDYTALELKAREALDNCLVIEGMADGADAGSAIPAGQADMTRFDAACSNSRTLLDVIGGTPAEATPLRATLCQCLVSTLAPQVSTADADVLAHDLDGTATDASRKAHAGYDTIAGIAGTAFGGCFATLLRH